MLLGLHRNITSTLLGPPVIDFGLAGAAVFMFLLAFILQLSRKSIASKSLVLQPFYPILLAYSVVWIETGLDQLDLVFFVAFFTAYLLVTSKK
jgi:oligosaccharide repeat unit polymerase